MEILRTQQLRMYQTGEQSADAITVLATHITIITHNRYYRAVTHVIIMHSVEMISNYTLLVCMNTVKLLDAQHTIIHTYTVM